MNITVIGRGNVGGGLAAKWRAAGHEVQELGRDGGDASDADVLLVAVPSGEIAERAREGERDRGQGGDRRDERVPRSQRGVRVARARGEVDRRRPGGEVVQPQLRRVLRRDRRAARAAVQPLRGADDDAREATEQLIRDAGYEPVYAGGLDQARLLEEMLPLLFAINQAGMGPHFYRFAPPGQL